GSHDLSQGDAGEVDSRHWGQEGISMFGQASHAYPRYPQAVGRGDNRHAWRLDPTRRRRAADGAGAGRLRFRPLEADTKQAMSLIHVVPALPVRQGVPLTELASRLGSIG